MRHQQEFLDLFHRMDEYGKNLAEQMSNVDAMLSVTQANQEKAREYVNTTWFDTTLLYFCPDAPDRHPYRWTGDGVPDNGEPVTQGADFPTNPAIGDWFLRVDFVPNRLYRFAENQRWKLMEKDTKREWQPYNWVVQLREFMSDRSEEDRERPWELKSLHDVFTSRHDRSDLSYEEKTENKEPYEVEVNKGELKDT